MDGPRKMHDDPVVASIVDVSKGTQIQVALWSGRELSTLRPLMCLRGSIYDAEP
jgi:hypothetical protein